MDIIHIEAHYKGDVVLPKDFIEKLPKEIILFTTVQYINTLNSIKKQLEENKISVSLIQTRHTCYKGQILGCSTQTIELNNDFVYIGDGLFHPKALLIRNKNRKVYSFNPKTGDQIIYDNKTTESILKKLKGLYSKFLMAKKIGVLITLKPGQSKPAIANFLETKYPEKQFYFFADHTYNFSSLADFKGIEMFLNTMCERIGLDDMDVQEIAIFNIEDLKDMEKGVFD